MKHYTKPDGSVWAFEADGSQDHLVTPDLTPITDAQLTILRAPTPEQQVEIERVAGIDEAIKTDATVQALKAMSSGEFDVWWAANVTTLAQANNVLKRLTRVIVRRVL
jgi:hypothetical protein